MIYILAFIVLIGVIVFVHELGHFWAARSVGVGVERFSVGMPPNFIDFTKTKKGLVVDIFFFAFHDKKIKWKKIFSTTFRSFNTPSETIYTIGLLPLGGYVKMKGILDESMDSDFKGADDELESKNALQKIWVMSAGVIMNLILTFFVFVLIANLPGGIQVPQDNKPIVDFVIPGENLGKLKNDNDSPIIEEIIKGSEAESYGLSIGDTILSINNKKLNSWTEISKYIGDLRKDKENLFSIEIKRQDEIYKIEKNSILDEPFGIGKSLLTQKGDIILSIDNKQINSWADIQDYIIDKPAHEFKLTLKRDGELIEIDSLKIGESPDILSGRVDQKIGTLDIQKNTIPLDPKLQFTESIVYGFNKTKWAMTLMTSSLKMIFQGNVSRDEVGSIIMIGDMAGQAAQAGLVPFLYLMALISVNLAYINILPIPGLDGGHIVLILIEVLMGRKLSVKTRIRIQSVGMFILLSLMVFLLLNDIIRVFF